MCPLYVYGIVQYKYSVVDARAERPRRNDPFIIGKTREKKNPILSPRHRPSTLLLYGAYMYIPHLHNGITYYIIIIIIICVVRREEDKLSYYIYYIVRGGPKAFDRVLQLLGRRWTAKPKTVRVFRTAYALRPELGLLLQREELPRSRTTYKPAGFSSTLPLYDWYVVVHIRVFGESNRDFVFYPIRHIYLFILLRVVTDITRTRRLFLFEFFDTEISTVINCSRDFSQCRRITPNLREKAIGSLVSDFSHTILNRLTACSKSCVHISLNVFASVNRFPQKWVTHNCGRTCVFFVNCKHSKQRDRIIVFEMELKLCENHSSF